MSVFLKRPVFFIWFIIFLFSAENLVFAQSAEEIDVLLDTNEVTYAQISYLILNAAQIQDVSSPDAAFNYAVQRNWLPRNASMQDKARLDTMALLVMQAFSIPGGVMYSITRSGSYALAAHYAYRELVYINIIQGRVSPQMKISGDQLLYIVNSVLAREEE